MFIKTVNMWTCHQNYNQNVCSSEFIVFFIFLVAILDFCKRKPISNPHPGDFDTR